MYSKFLLSFVFFLALAEAVKLNGAIPLGSIPPGTGCRLDEDCAGGEEGRSYCGPYFFTQLCMCYIDYIENEAWNDCIPKRQINQTCEEGKQCMIGGNGGNHGCLPSEENPSENICRCSDTGVAEPDQHWCYRKPERVGSLCEIDFQCTTSLGELAFCDKRFDGWTWCQCKEGSVPNEEYTGCVPGTVLPGTVQPKGTCKTEEDCRGSPVRSHCASDLIGRHCSCRTDLYLENEIGTDCIPKRAMGETCEESGQCQIGGAVEDKGCLPSVEDLEVKICQCSDTGVEGNGHQWCYKKATHVGDYCVIKEQCTANLGELSQCDGIMCHCVEGAEPNEEQTACVRTNNSALI